MSLEVVLNVPAAAITAERCFLLLFILNTRTIDIGSELLSLARAIS